MEYSERDLEDFLVDNNTLLDYFDLMIVKRQYRTAYGIIDLLCYDPSIHGLVVVEIKKGTVDENAVGQLLRYMSAIKDIVNNLERIPDLPEEIKTIRNVTGILLGADATDGVKNITRYSRAIRFIKTTVTLDVVLKEPACSRNDNSINNDLYIFSEVTEDILDQIDYYKQIKNYREGREIDGKAD